MNAHIPVNRGPRGKGLRGRAARRKKHDLHRPVATPKESNR